MNDQATLTDQVEPLTHQDSGDPPGYTLPRMVAEASPAASDSMMSSSDSPSDSMRGESSPASAPERMAAVDLNLFYGKKQALMQVSATIQANAITALIGPSGCGKTTFLRCLNRMNDLIDGVRIEGDVLLDGESIYARGVDVVELRQRVGMVFQKPNPFPMSVFDNIAYGPRLQGIRQRQQLEAIVESTLQDAALWDEMKDNLRQNALAISGGQQQRLCIARALATQPEVLLMDEPCSALDPISTLKIEELMRELKQQYTIVIVTHNMQQAARVSDTTGFFLLGELVEMDSSSRIFTKPSDQRTEDYITGRFG